jgi:hypothetical protein
MRQIIFAIAWIAWIAVCAGAAASVKITIVSMGQPSKPVGWGIGQLRTIMEGRGIDVSVADQAPADATNVIQAIAGANTGVEGEAFEIRVENNAVIVEGGGPVGAMYGLLQLAEGVRYAPEGTSFENLAQIAPQGKAAPAIPTRGINSFLHVQAFLDPESWYYQDEYWEKYLDMLAWSRLNFLDWHATFDLDTTLFPNVFPYLIKSDKFPKVGVPDDQKDRNLAIFKRMCAMAHERGIRVGLMSYIASWKVPGNPNPPYEESDDNLIAYTREVVRKIVDECPDLDVIGFRIGESGRPEDFYDRSYIPGIADARRPIDLYTRTWVATPEKVRSLADHFPGKTILEIKYNGEHLGRPYIVEGNRMGGWGSYSYQDYLTADMNYDVIWQIRANGTHRVFRWADPGFIRRCVMTTTFAGSDGFCVEPFDAYYPKEQKYIHKVDHGYKYSFERDWFWYMLWGRLAYDPQTPDGLWVAEFERRMPGRGLETYGDMLTASQVVPWIYTYHCMGPDHRNMAPEMEWGGDLDYFLTEQPLDLVPLRSLKECVDYTIGGWASARVGSEVVVAKLAAAWALAETIEHAKDNREVTPEERCILEDCRALGHLAGYYMNKIMAAEALGIFRKTMDRAQLTLASQLTEKAISEWGKLADVTSEHYRPLIERLRTGMRDFTWATQLPKMDQDRKILEQARQQFEEWLPACARPAEPDTGEQPKLGAVPVHRVYLASGTPEEVRAKAPFARVTVGAPPTVDVFAWYRQPGGDWRSVEMDISDAYVFVPARGAKIDYGPGDLEYYYEARVGDRSYYWPPDTEGNPSPVQCAVMDRVPALAIGDLKWELNGAKDRVRVQYHVEAEAGVRSAHVKYKPLPSTAPWSVTDAKVDEDGNATGEFPVSPAGAVFYVYVYDNAGGGLSYPEFEYQTPYVLVPPWSSPAGG